MAQITLNSSGVASNGTLALQSNGTTTAATIDTSGRLLIGGTTTYDFNGQSNLVVNGTANNSTITIASTSDGYLAFADGTTGTQPYAGRIGYFHASNYMDFFTNGTECMRIDSAGNLGLGVTPSAWSSTFKGFQIGSTGSIWSIASGNGGTYYGNNYIYGASGRTYLTTGTAVELAMASGKFEFGIAASGTAGSTVTFTSAMTLDANGRLFVNTTTEPGSNDSAVVIKAGGTSKSRCLSLEAVTTGSVIIQTFRNPNGQVGYIATDGSSTSYVTSSDYRLKESIQPMTGALAKVALLKPVTYKWKVDGSDGQGFIAHELQEVVPDAVSGAKDATEIQKYEISPAVPATFDEEGNELTPAVEAVMGEREVAKHQGIDTSFLVATLTAAIQELKAIVDAQAVEIAALKAK